MELDIPFTQVRTPHLFPYPVYALGAFSSTENMGEFQEGIEVGGGLPRDVRWSAAVVRTRAVGADESSGANVFLRARKRAGDHRFGAFAYLGLNSRTSTRTARDGLRVGAYASLVQRLNLTASTLVTWRARRIAGWSAGTSASSTRIRKATITPPTGSRALRGNVLARRRRRPDRETVDQGFPGCRF